MWGGGGGDGGVHSISVAWSLCSNTDKQGRKEMFYLTTHSTHFIYGYMASDIYMVKDQSDSERGNPTTPHWLLFPINSKGYFICNIPTDRIAHTTAFVTPVVEHWLEREIGQWVHPMKDRSDDPSHHEQTLLPGSYISLFTDKGAGRSSEVERSLMVRWVVGSILHGVDPLSYFSFHPVFHDWCNKGRGMCYPVCGMVHIKEPLLLIDKSSLCGGSGFPFSLSEWSLTICLKPYNRR